MWIKTRYGEGYHFRDICDNCSVLSLLWSSSRCSNSLPWNLFDLFAHVFSHDMCLDRGGLSFCALLHSICSNFAGSLRKYFHINSFRLVCCSVWRLRAMLWKTKGNNPPQLCWCWLLLWWWFRFQQKHCRVLFILFYVLVSVDATFCLSLPCVTGFNCG